MNETFDKLLIRIIFTFFICLALLLYKYAHVIFYPSHKKQVLKKIYPSENYIDTLHIFARLIGVSIIFSTLEFNEYIGISISLLHFIIWSIIGFALYLISIYLTESIIFYNFDYKDEVLKKRNASYGVVSFINSICLAILLKTVFKESENSLPILIILWLFTIVVYGFATRLYKYTSPLSFNSLMIQKNLGLGFSYVGYLLGITIILVSSFSHEHHDISSYLIQIMLKILLAIIVLPIFIKGIKYIFKIDDETRELPQKQEFLHLGTGIYIGSSFLTSSFLTSIIIGQIHFGTIYPFF